MAAVSVTTTATRLDTVSETDDRAGSSIAVYNNGASTVYLGAANTVTAATGYPLAAGEHYAQDLQDATKSLWGIVASGTVEVRTIESGVS